MILKLASSLGRALLKERSISWGNPVRLDGSIEGSIYCPLDSVLAVRRLVYFLYVGFLDDGVVRSGRIDAFIP